MNKKLECNKNLVSVIVPIFNTEKFLSKCIAGLLEQSYPNKEIILVDDGSEKKCADLCDRIASQHDIVSVIHKENGGVSSARNVGIQEANGEYLYFCDSDDIPAPNLLEKLVDSIESTNCDIVTCSYIRFKDEKEICFSNGSDDKVVYGDERLDVVICDNRYGGYLWNKLFNKRIIVEENLMFDETLNIIEDALFVLQYITKTHSLILIEDNLYAYRDSEFSVTNSNFSLKTMTAAIGQKKIYELLVSEDVPLYLQKWVWKKMMQSIVISYKKLFFSKIEAREKWLLLLKDIFKNYKNVFNIWKEFSIKEFIYYIFIEIT